MMFCNGQYFAAYSLQLSPLLAAGAARAAGAVFIYTAVCKICKYVSN